KLQQPAPVARDVGLSTRSIAPIHNRFIHPLNVECTHADVMPDTELLGAWRLAPDHVLDPVIALRSHHRDPVDTVILRPALPLEAKTENIFVEPVLRGRVLHMNADMEHMVGNALG